MSASCKVSESNKVFKFSDCSILASKPGGNSKTKKLGHYSEKMRFDDKTGKMLVDEHQENASTSTPDDDNSESKEALQGSTAYHESMVSVDGHKTDSKGAVKFNKSNKRSRAAEAADEIMAELNEEPQEKRIKKSNGKTSKIQLGSEFKAKKAAGDVQKKGQLEPYAYLPLAGPKKTKAYSITGKKRNSATK